MTHSLERLLDVAATSDVIPYVLVEIPTNPRVEVPDVEHLGGVAQTPYTPGAMPFHQYSSSIKLSVPMCALAEKIMADGKTLAYVSGSKFPSGGRCTAGFVTANQRCMCDG